MKKISLLSITLSVLMLSVHIPAEAGLFQESCNKVVKTITWSIIGVYGTQALYIILSQKENSSDPQKADLTTLRFDKQNLYLLIDNYQQHPHTAYSVWGGIYNQQGNPMFTYTFKHKKAYEPTTVKLTLVNLETGIKEKRYINAISSVDDLIDIMLQITSNKPTNPTTTAQIQVKIRPSQHGRSDSGFNISLIAGTILLLLLS